MSFSRQMAVVEDDGPRRLALLGLLMWRDLSAPANYRGLRWTDTCTEGISDDCGVGEDRAWMEDGDGYSAAHSSDTGPVEV
jgi:hypothetical protein